MLAAVAGGLALTAIGAGEPAPRSPKTEPSASEVRFTDVTEAAGLRFRHQNGAAGGKLLPETMGSGVAWLDFDGDRRLDLLLVNGRSWQPDGEKTTAALYRNRGPGEDGTVTFEDVTRGSGLDVELYGFGVAVTDFDGDRRPDVYLTALEGDRLFRNLGPGDGGRPRFEDVTEAAGIDNRGFGTSAAWLDYDLDGRADLFVANYVTWSPETDQRCSLDGKTRSYCTPEVYPGSAGKLFRNLGPDARGRVRFEDVSAGAGVADASAKALGVAVLDFDGDRRPDLFVANDTEPNQLFHNRGPGADGPGSGKAVRFEDVALEAGVAYSETGTARGAMGTDAADYDRSGRPHLAVANFANETAALYRNLGPGPGGTVRFEDRAPASAVGRATLATLAFGAFFFDYDLDGWLDLLLANGHIDDGVERVQPGIAFRQPPQLFRNLGRSGDTVRFEEVSGRVGPDFREPLLARGAAYGDYDGDGDLDVAIAQNGGPPRLFRNDGGERNRWLRVRLLGRRSTPDGLGAVVRVTSASGTQWRAVASGSSYASESERTLTFGLGRDREVESLEVEWPTGERQRFEGISPNRELTVEEGKGIVE